MRRKISGCTRSRCERYPKIPHIKPLLVSFKMNACRVLDALLQGGLIAAKPMGKKRRSENQIRKTSEI
jgi:hypothetical protein